jgi:hypothetical protein
MVVSTLFYEADHTIDDLVTAVTSAAIVPRLAGTATQNKT